MCDWLKLLIFSNLLIIHSFGRAVASHSVGGCRPPFFFSLFYEFHEREIGIIFLLPKLWMIDTTTVFLNLKQFHSFIMEWVLTSQHNSVVFQKCFHQNWLRRNSYVRRV